MKVSVEHHGKKQVVSVNRSKPKKTIDWDTWAASGGTGGIFGKDFRTGRLIVVPNTESEKFLTKYARKD